MSEHADLTVNPLAPDDPGVLSSDHIESRLAMREQDDAFRAAMGRALAAGAERAPQPSAPDLDRVVKQRFAGGVVLTCSPMAGF